MTEKEVDNVELPSAPSFALPSAAPHPLLLLLLKLLPRYRFPLLLKLRDRRRNLLQSSTVGRAVLVVRSYCCPKVLRAPASELLAADEAEEMSSEEPSSPLPRSPLLVVGGEGECVVESAGYAGRGEDIGGEEGGVAGVMKGGELSSEGVEGDRVLPVGDELGLARLKGKVGGEEGEEEEKWGVGRRRRRGRIRIVAEMAEEGDGRI